MKQLKEKASNKSFAEIPEIEISGQSDIEECRIVLKKIRALGESLNVQANQLGRWRERIIELLLLPLVDEEGVLDVIGDEYDISIKQQNKCMWFISKCRDLCD